MNYKILADVTYIARQKMFYLWSYSSDTASHTCTSNHSLCHANTRHHMELSALVIIRGCLFSDIGHVGHGKFRFA